MSLSGGPQTVPDLRENVLGVPRTRLNQYNSKTIISLQPSNTFYTVEKPKLDTS